MPEYFAAVETEPGLNALPHNPCKLLDFHLLALPAGESFSAATGDREVVAVILGGRVTITVEGKRFDKVGGRPNVFTGKPHAVYLPAGVTYKIKGEGAAEVGLCSAPSDLKTAPYVITPDQVTTGVWGAANFTRNYHQILTAAGQPDLPARRLIVGETYTPSGNWSTYPPHKHEEDNVPKEAYHEEMYFFRVNPPDGFGIVRHYDGAGYEVNYTVRNNTILMIPHGYHTYVGAPGYTSYYLWCLAGEHRTQAVALDPEAGWVQKAEPMLRQLGH